jgi:hypothetical protein
MTAETISQASMVENDDLPTVLIVTTGAGAAVMLGWRSVAVLAVGQLIVGQPGVFPGVGVMAL